MRDINKLVDLPQNNQPSNNTPKSPTNKRDINRTVAVSELDYSKYVEADRGIRFRGSQVGSHISQFDKGIAEANISEINLVRATRQPGTHKFMNALVGGLASGVMIAGQDISLILDIPNNIKMLRGIENAESNLVADWFKDNEEYIMESMPIYRKRPNQIFDWKDSGFFWEAFRGMISSAVGFGAVGMGAAGLVKGIGAGIRMASYQGKVNQLKAFTNMVGKSIQTGEVGNVSAALISNFGEGKLMGLELYETSYNLVVEELSNKFKEETGQDFIPESKLEEIQNQASRIAGDKTGNFILQNTAFAFTNYLQIKSIFKASLTLTRNQIPKPSAKEFWKTQLATAPKEYFEEVGQNVLQMEGEYQTEQTLRELGVNIKDPVSDKADWGQRFLEFATSDQAQLEGLMGLLSGPIQYAVTTAPFQNKEARLKQYSDQETTIQKNKEFFKSKVTATATRKQAMEKAMAAGENRVAEAFKLQEFDILALENFNRGTTDNLESVLREELHSEEYTDAEKQTIQEKLDRLLSMEQEYTKFKDYANSTGIYGNRLQKRQFEDLIKVSQDRVGELTQEIQNDYTAIINAYNKKAGEDNQLSFGDVLQAMNTNDFSKIPNEIKQLLVQDENIGRAIGFLSGEDGSGGIVGLENSLGQLQADFNAMKTPEYNLGYSRLQAIMGNQRTNTEEKIEQLNKLQSNTKNLPSIFTQKLANEKQTLEEFLRISKELQGKTNNPVTTTKAAVNAANSKKTNTPVVLTPEQEFESKLDDDQKRDLETVRAGLVLLEIEHESEKKASSMSLLELSQLDSSIQDNARQVNEDFQASPDETKIAIIDLFADDIGNDNNLIKNKIIDKSQERETELEKLQKEKADKIAEKKKEIEELETNPVIESLVNTVVYYQGKPFVLKREGVRFILENETTIIELSANSQTKIKELNIELPFKKAEIASKYNVQLLEENEVKVNDNLYIIRTDNKGNVVGLSPSNKTDQVITNEKMLIAVEIERNKNEFNSIDEILIEEDNYNEIIKDNLALEFIEGIFSKNWNQTISDALDKLYGNSNLTEQERLQLDLWVTDAIIELTKLYTKNPKIEYANALDNLELINILLYTGNHQEYERQSIEKTGINKSTTKETRTISKETRSKPEVNKVNKQSPEKSKKDLLEEELAAIEEEYKQKEDAIKNKPDVIIKNTTSVETITEISEQQDTHTTDDEIETRTFTSDNNKELNEANDSLLEVEGALENTRADVGNKVTVFGSNEYYKWLVNGEDKTGHPVTYSINFGNKAKRSGPALALYAKYKADTESITDEEYESMIDNLPITFTSKENSAIFAFLYTPREASSGNAKASERQLRKQIVASILAGVTAEGVIEGQYGGNLKIVEDNVSIKDIPDFVNLKNSDIPLWYVDSDGHFKDSETRKRVTDDIFVNIKVLLKASGRPMTGALATVVKKANGTEFPLVLNINNLNDTEVKIVGNILYDLIKPSVGDINTLEKKVSDKILELIPQVDKDFFGNNITYKEVLNFYVFEGMRSTSNTATQLYFKDGVVYFGADKLNIDNFLTNKDKLIEFLKIYKTRNVDLARIQKDKTYREHIFNSGVITTNTDVSGDTLFESLDTKAMQKRYPNTMEGGPNAANEEKAKNRFRTGSVYVSSNITNPVVQSQEASTETTTQTSPKPTTAIKTNSGNITIRPDGKMFYDNGNEVTEETVKNKALVKQADEAGTLKEATILTNDPDRSLKYAILPDNRIISLNSTSDGKEVYKTGPQRLKIIGQVKQPTSTVDTKAVEIPTLSTVKVDLKSLNITELENVAKQLRQKAVSARQAEKEGMTVLGGSSFIESDYQAVKKYIAELKALKATPEIKVDKTKLNTEKVVNKVEEEANKNENDMNNFVTKPTTKGKSTGLNLNQVNKNNEKTAKELEKEAKDIESKNDKKC